MNLCHHHMLAAYERQLKRNKASGVWARPQLETVQRVLDAACSCSIQATLSVASARISAARWHAASTFESSEYFQRQGQVMTGPISPTQTGGKRRRKRQQASAKGWQRTSRKVTLKSGEVRAVYRHAATGRLAVKKFVSRGKRRHAIYSPLPAR